MDVFLRAKGKEKFVMYEVQDENEGCGGEVFSRV